MGWIVLIVLVVLGVIVLAALPKKSEIGSSKGLRPNLPPSRTNVLSAYARVASPTPLDGANEIKWIGRGSSLEVAGFRLRDPLVYASFNRSPLTYWASDPSEVMVHAEVRRPRGPLPEMGYWPWYSRIEPEHRFAYLDWLATGKQTLPRSEGLLFLYYYGLERRILIDEQDHEVVLQEVVRLLRLDESRRGSRDGASFRRYTSALLWYQIARAPELFDDRGFEKVCSFTERWSEELISVALSWIARNNQPLPHELARSVAQLSPDAQRSVVLKRVGDEFNELFAKRYKERYGNGMMLRVSKRPRRHMYRPASGGLNELSCTIADPMGIPSQFNPLAELWNSCIDDLRRLSKVSVAPNGGTISIDTWEAMPPDLREDVEHPLAAKVHSMIQDGSRDGQECIVQAGQLSILLTSEQRPKLTITQSRRLAETVEFTGYSVEPDARLTARAYGWNDSIAIFLRTDESAVDAQRYGGAACVLQLSLTVAEADGQVDEEELRKITERIEAMFELPDHERRRLEALQALLLTTGVNNAAVTKRIEQSLTASARTALARLLVAVAATDGTIDRKELSALRKCYRALGLGPELLEQLVAELAPSADSGLVTVQSGRPAPRGGEAIPAAREARIELNREAISAIMAETREVAKLLADAMIDDDNNWEQPESFTQVAVASVQSIEPDEQPKGVDSNIDESKFPAGRYLNLYSALIGRDRWAREDAEELARVHDVMLNGAIEAINDWAFDALGGPVVEEVGEEIVVDRSLL